MPNSGNPQNGMIYAKDGYLTGGYLQGVRLAPRFGFAWSPFKATVIRGGFGNSYDRARTDQDNNEAQVPPNVLTPVLYYGSLNNINSTTANGARGTIGLTAVSPNDTTPHVYSYNLGIQRNVGWGVVLDVSYVGSLGRNLQQVINLNAVPYGATFKASSQDPTKYTNGVVPAVQPGLQRGIRERGTVLQRPECAAAGLPPAVQGLWRYQLPQQRSVFQLQLAPGSRSTANFLNRW